MPTDYSTTTVEDLFMEIVKKPEPLDQTPAEMWIEAENVMELKKLLVKWFYMMEDGTAFMKKPDPLNSSWNEKRARKLVEELDLDFNIESTRWPSYDVEEGPEYIRLTGGSLIAFAQEYDKIRKKYSEIKEEAKRRLDKGEKILPEQYLLTLKERFGYCSQTCSMPIPDGWFGGEHIIFSRYHGDHSKTAEEIFEEVIYIRQRKELERLSSSSQEVDNTIGWIS